MSALSLYLLAEAGLSAAWLRTDVGAWLLLIAACVLPALILGSFGLRWLVRAVLSEDLNELRRRLDECFAAVIDLRMQAYELATGETPELFLAERREVSTATEPEPPRACA